MSELQKLKAAASLSQFAQLLRVKTAMLSFQLYKKPKTTLYRKFEIAKRQGGVREILAPESDLKLLQHRLSELLQTCTVEVNAIHGHVETANLQGIAHGFKPFHSIMTNGRAHVARRFVFNVDLRDFFGSINFGRVRGFFISDENYKLHPDVATLIAQIACHENKLPQGSPCSPVISNLIGHKLDLALVRLAAGTGSTYTRYADDLTFSTNKRLFPNRLAVQTNENQWKPGHGLKRVVERSGFSFNEAKTRMQYRDSRQEVTGLTVNRKVNVPATYRYTVRAMVDSVFKTGDFFLVRNRLDTAGIITVEQHPGKRKQLLGMLSYIDQVDRFNKNLNENNGLEPADTHGRIELFRRFLYFDMFYALDQPLIVCEGKTDNIYLKSAMQSLAALYPSLVAPGPPAKQLIRFLKYADQRTAEITQLTGGVGGICNLLRNYHRDLTLKFKAPKPKHPVIVLIDNDNGASSIYEAIAGITKQKKPAGMADFIHVTGNLYVVPTPFGPKKSRTAIEDFFDAQTLAHRLNGKTFNREKKIDESTEYGKTAFALNVVAKNAGTIDFGGFKPVLDRVGAVLIDYAGKLKLP